MSGVRPWQGCAHDAGAMSFDVYVARCGACGAEWHRSSDGPWRCVDPGGDREGRQTCGACGAETGAHASSCGLCGRPLVTVAALALEVHAKQAAIRRKRSELGLAPGERILPPLDNPDGGMRAD